MFRRALLPAALFAALAGCAPALRGGTSAAAAPPPTTALFEPYPAAEIRGVKSPHDYKGKPLCQRCHFPDGKLTAAPNVLCAGCHVLKHGNHPVNVAQKTPIEGLPLLAGGMVACHTCHEPHAKKSALRKPFDELCTACHTGH